MSPTLSVKKGKLLPYYIPLLSSVSNNENQRITIAIWCLWYFFGLKWFKQLFLLRKMIKYDYRNYSVEKKSKYTVEKMNKQVFTTNFSLLYPLWQMPLRFFLSLAWKQMFQTLWVFIMNNLLFVKFEIDFKEALIIFKKIKFFPT
jgi:hypothetical protein